MKHWRKKGLLTDRIRIHSFSISDHNHDFAWVWIRIWFFFRGWNPVYRGSGSAALHLCIYLLLKILRCEWTTQYIDPPPQTFDDAIEVYKSLPAKSLEDERVVSFSITPLSDYCGAIDEIINDISDQNIEFVTNMIVDFEAVDKVFRRLKSTKLASDFLTYRSILLDLERRFELQRSQFIYRIQCRVD